MIKGNSADIRKSVSNPEKACGRHMWTFRVEAVKVNIDSMTNKSPCTLNDHPDTYAMLRSISWLRH